MTDAVPLYTHDGFCPICARSVRFVSANEWFRDHLLCEVCGSIPRERGLALVMEERFPNWRSLKVHESSPVMRGISAKLARECPSYIASQCFPDAEPGALRDGVRNEDLERQTFPDRSLDLVITLDVMEHVNEPAAAFAEIWRTLRPGGAYLFSVPTYKENVVSERAARFHTDGRIEHFREPEYHGNPVDPRGSLMTFRYGYDLPELIRSWAPLDTRVYRFHDHHHGLIGAFTEIYLCEQRAEP